MALLKLGSPDLGKCPTCGQRLFQAAHVTRKQGQAYHPECVRRASRRPSKSHASAARV